LKVRETLQLKDWFLRRVSTDLVLEGWAGNVRASTMSEAHNSQIDLQLFQGTELAFPHA
jgi:hypothetical protein